MEFTDKELSVIYSALGKENNDAILPFLDEEAREDYASRSQGGAFTVPSFLIDTYEGRQKLVHMLQSATSEAGVAEASYLKLLCNHGALAEEAVEQAISLLKSVPRREGRYETYLHHLTGFPYGLMRKMEIDIAVAAKKIEEDLYGMRKAKETILEFLALWFYSSNPHPPAILLSGPPGVGKTAFAYAVANALNIPTVKIAFAGLFDTAVLSGMQMGWASSTPGLIFSEFVRVKCANPVVVCDEIEKGGGSSVGKVEYILAELLNPSQSCSYKDNFMNFSVDLSKAFYICTCNELHEVPPYIRDRCHVIEIEEYTETERFTIIKKYLPGQLKEENGLSFTLEISDEAASRLSRVPSLREAKRRMLSLAARRLKEGERPMERLRLDYYDETLFRGPAVRQPLGFI
jgi:ATP-dependent Lon protease